MCEFSFPFLTLPTELQHEVLVAVVRARGVKRGLRLRLVSRDFATAVTEALYDSDLLEAGIRNPEDDSSKKQPPGDPTTDNPKHPWTDDADDAVVRFAANAGSRQIYCRAEWAGGPEFWAGYLTHRSLARSKPLTPALRTLRQVAEWVVRYRLERRISPAERRAREGTSQGASPSEEKEKPKEKEESDELSRPSTTELDTHDTEEVKKCIAELSRLRIFCGMLSRWFDLVLNPRHATTEAVDENSSDFRFSLLAAAAYLGEKQLVVDLLPTKPGAGVSRNYENGLFRTPFEAAALGGRLDIIYYLLRTDGPETAPGPYLAPFWRGDVPFLAARARQPLAVEFGLEPVPKPTRYMKDWRYDIARLVAFCSDVGSLRSCLVYGSGGAGFGSPLRSGSFLPDQLIFAAARGDLETMRYLMADRKPPEEKVRARESEFEHGAGVSPNGREEYASHAAWSGDDGKSGTPPEYGEPLRKAAAHGRFEAVKLLIERGADVPEEDIGGELLKCAAFGGSTRVLDLLLEEHRRRYRKEDTRSVYDAKLGVVVREALLRALKREHDAMVRRLLEVGEPLGSWRGKNEAKDPCLKFHWDGFRRDRKLAEREREEEAFVVNDLGDEDGDGRMAAKDSRRDAGKRKPAVEHFLALRPAREEPNHVDRYLHVA